MAVQGLVENLRSFDSHERGLLLDWATGSPMTLDKAVRDAIDVKIGRKPPADAFVAIDYTLDWLYAATRWTLEPAKCRYPQPWPAGGELSASPEDVDLVIAWEDQHGPHLVLLEAKGFTGWSNKQMVSKARRLDVIFGAGLARDFDVHFILVGPAPSKGLKTQSWPDWMRPGQRAHFLKISDPGPRRAVQRCNADGVGLIAGYTHWQSVDRSWTKAGVSGPAPVEQ
jgi:hypothetical protein